MLEQAEADDITIHNVIYPEYEESVDSNSDLVQPYALYHSYSVTGRIFSGRSPLAAQHYASVARGKTVTMSTAFKSTINVSSGGGIPVGAGSTINAIFGSSKSKTIHKGIKLTGPPAGYSSRQYYITRFVDRGSFTLIEKID